MGCGVKGHLLIRIIHSYIFFMRVNVDKVDLYLGHGGTEQGRDASQSKKTIDKADQV